MSGVRFDISPAGLEEAVAQRAKAAEEARIASRIWDGDDTVFGPAGQPEVANRLGWLHVGERTGEILSQLRELAAGARDRGDRVVLVLGMGGSSLAPEVLSRAFADVDGAPELRVLDSTVPNAVLEAQAGIDPEHTLVIAASKSGSTVETRSQLELFWELLGQQGERFAVITDPGSALEKLASERRFRATVLADPDVGGRYSALTAFGLTPAAVAGYPFEELLQSGADMAQRTRSDAAGDNPALHLGLLMGEAAKAGRDKLTVVADPTLGDVQLWLEQLVAESTGKHGVGVVPVAGEEADATHFGDDRVVLRLRNAASPVGPLDGLADRICAAGAPSATIEVDGAEELGGLFFACEFATAVCGWVLDINPFDQPNVQEAKDATNAVLGGSVELPSQGDADVTALLDGLTPPGYCGVLAYVAPTPGVDEAAARLTAAIRETTGAATTFGYGPRYLHSTGQLHKGGPSSGRFLLVVDVAEADVQIPGEDHGFRTLMHAQALGDLQTLGEHDLPAVLVQTDGAAAETLHELAELVRGTGS